MSRLLWADYHVGGHLGRHTEERQPWGQNGEGKNSKKITVRTYSYKKNPLALSLIAALRHRPEHCGIKCWNYTRKTVPVCHGMPYLAGRFSKFPHASPHGEFHDDAKTKLGPNPRFNWETKTYIRLAAMYLVTTTTPQKNTRNTACISSWRWNLSLHQAMYRWGCISPGKVAFSNLHKSWVSWSHDPWRELHFLEGAPFLIAWGILLASCNLILLFWD